MNLEPPKFLTVRTNVVEAGVYAFVYSFTQPSKIDLRPSPFPKRRNWDEKGFLIGE